MPLVDLAPPPIDRLAGRPEDFAVTPGAADLDHGSDAPTSWLVPEGQPDVLGAAMRQGNVIGSAISRQDSGVSYEPEPGFNPWDAIKGTKYEPNWQSFVDIRNTAAADARKRQIDGEEQDKRTIASAPWYMRLPAQLLAGTADPTILAPGAAFVRTTEGAISIARTALSTAAGAGAGATLQEAGLHATQQTRTFGESVENIGASVFLGGLLGAGGAKLMSNMEWNAGLTKLNGQLADATLAPTNALYRETKAELLAKGIGEAEADTQARAAVMEAGIQGINTPASAGAAAHEPVSLENNTIAGTLAQNAAWATKKLNPFMRVLQNPSAAARDTIQRLAEFTGYTEGNFANVASPLAAETRIKRWQGGLTTAIHEGDAIFADYRKGGGQLSADDFRQAVGKAMRRDDEATEPAIAAAAKTWRDKVVDPLKDAAVDVGLLPKDVEPKFAPSYFSRMWNRNRIIGEEGRFKSIVSEFAREHIGQEWEKATAGFNARKAALEQELADISLPADQRAAKLEELENALQEHEAKGGKLLDQADRLSDLRGIARNVTVSEGTPGRAKEEMLAKIKGEREAITETGGEKLKNFIATRSNLRARRRNVDLGAAGLAERSQRIMESLADLEEGNQRSLGRLVAKGQKLERELDKLDPDTLAERISGMRDSFVEVARRSDAAADRADKAITGLREQAAKRAGRADKQEERARVEGEKKAGGPSLLTFLAKRGGLSADDPLAADVRAIFGGNPTVPGLGRLIRKGGRKLDESREAAVEAGYISKGAGPRGDNTTIKDLLDALNDESRGRKRYAAGEEPHLGFDPDEERARREEAGQAPRSGEKAQGILSEADQKIADRLEKHAAEQRARADRMEVISHRLDIAEGFDRDGAVAELRAATQKAIAETSSTTLGRGERAQRMLERLAALDPQRIKDRADTIAKMKAELERSYYDRWETKALGKDVDPNAPMTRPDFTDHANGIAEHIYNTFTGRTEAGIRPEFVQITTRGPMKDRTFHIPDLYTSPVHGAIEDFLEHDVKEVMTRYTRVMGADVEVQRQFGSLDLKDEVGKVTESYAKLREGVTDPRQLNKFKDMEKSDKDDILGTLDNIRGNRQAGKFERDWGAIVRSANHVGNMLHMGEVVLSSLQDAVRPAMVHGLLPYMRTIGQLATNLKAIKLSARDAQLMGNIAERVTPQRLATVTELNDPMARRGPIEAILGNLSDLASKWNGIRLWTDGWKSIASVMSQNRILENAGNWAELSKSERAYMQFLGIDESMAGRIAARFDEHGKDLHGVKWANVAEWGKTDPVARDAFSAAMNKDVDSIIVIPSKADVPLMAHTPVGKMLLQFRSFTLASNQRVMIRGLQESPTRFISSALAMTALGMLQVYLKALSGNHMDKLQSISDNPGWWVGEAIDKASFLPVFMELSNDFEKLTTINPMKSPLKMLDKSHAESQKVQQGQPFSLMGPALGSVADAGMVVAGAGAAVTGKDVPKWSKNAAVRLMPFNSYLGMKQFLSYFANPPQH